MQLPRRPHRSSGRFTPRQDNVSSNRCGYHLSKLRISDEAPINSSRSTGGFISLLNGMLPAKYPWSLTRLRSEIGRKEGKLGVQRNVLFDDAWLRSA